MSETFYFAWIDPTETFNPAVHNRFDETVFSFDYEQHEGDFASLKLVIKNPRIGFLNSARKVWGILSFNDGATITPLFKGRLIGVPSNVFDTLVTIEFTARPANFVAQKKTLANTLRVLPYWDPIFISPDVWIDDDTVLEARSDLWHIDPVTLILTHTNILVPEDGTQVFDETQHFYDGMQVTLNQVPARSVQMVATIPWTQTSLGGLDLAPRILQMFAAADPDSTGISGVITSYTMQGLISNWPKEGSTFGSGWKVLVGDCVDTTSTVPMAKIPDIFSWQGTVPDVSEGSIIFPLKTTGEYHWGEKAGFNLQFELVIAQLGYGAPSLNVTWDAGRDFGQIVTFTLRTNQQSIVTLPGVDESVLLTMSANKVDEKDYFNQIPIGDVRRRDYVHTARGQRSIEYLLLVARAHLCAKSRAVEIAITTGFKEGLRARSLRKGTFVSDPRLPGGSAEGKNVAFKMSLDGATGSAECVITFACCVGYGGAYTGSPGTPTYVDAGYMDDTQEYANTVVLTDTADIAWTMPQATSFDDGLDFIKGLTPSNALISSSIINPPAVQKATIGAAINDPNVDQTALSTLLATVPTQISMQLKPMEGGPFQQEVVISVSDLIVPKQIDLEAPSNA